MVDVAVVSCVLVLCRPLWFWMCVVVAVALGVDVDRGVAGFIRLRVQAKTKLEASRAYLAAYRTQY